MVMLQFEQIVLLLYILGFFMHFRGQSHIYIYIYLYL